MVKMFENNLRDTDINTNGKARTVIFELSSLMIICCQTVLEKFYVAYIHVSMCLCASLNLLQFSGVLVNGAF